MQDDIAMCTNKPFGRDQTDKKEIKVPFGEYMYIVSGGRVIGLLLPAVFVSREVNHQH